MAHVKDYDGMALRSCPAVTGRRARQATNNILCNVMGCCSHKRTIAVLLADG